MTSFMICTTGSGNRDGRGMQHVWLRHLYRVLMAKSVGKIPCGRIGTNGRIILVVRARGVQKYMLMF